MNATQQGWTTTISGLDEDLETIETVTIEINEDADSEGEYLVTVTLSSGDVWDEESGLTLKQAQKAAKSYQREWESMFKANEISLRENRADALAEVTIDWDGPDAALLKLVRQAVAKGQAADLLAKLS